MAATAFRVTCYLYADHQKIVEKILEKKYSKPVSHRSASEVVRRALEHYAEHLGVDLH